MANSEFCIFFTARVSVYA